MTDSKGFNK